jgi:hypothetical protein
LVAFLALRSTIDAGQSQQALAEQGQITDRFTRAIDQLGQDGDDKIAIRLGGIYALERIMYDSAKDQRNVVEVLCAFVRENTRTARTGLAPSPVPAFRDPATDVQAALTVLGRRPGAGQRFFGRDPRFGIVNLNGAHLELADLRGAHLEGAVMIGTHLERADLRLAHLERADLRLAYLEGALLIDTHIEEANMTGVHR